MKTLEWIEILLEAGSIAAAGHLAGVLLEADLLDNTPRWEARVRRSGAAPNPRRASRYLRSSDTSYPGQPFWSQAHFVDIHRTTATFDGAVEEGPRAHVSSLVYKGMKTFEIGSVLRQNLVAGPIDRRNLDLAAGQMVKLLLADRSLEHKPTARQKLHPGNAPSPARGRQSARVGKSSIQPGCRQSPSGAPGEGPTSSKMLA